MSQRPFRPTCLLSACALVSVLLALDVQGSLGGTSHAMVVTPSGLRYTDLLVGQGQEATDGKIVEVRYTGWLEDGKKFDSTESCDKPMTFRMGAGDVIKGLEQGVTGMREGGKRRLVIPPVLGFGKQGGGEVIPPNAILTYEVELVAVR